MAGLIHTELWNNYCEEVARGGYVGSSGKVQQALDAEDVKDLSALLSEAAEPERNAALSLLMALSAQFSPLLRPERVQSMVPALRRIAESDYPGGKAGQQAMTLWQTINPEGAAGFICEWVDNNEITEATSVRVTTDLSLGNKESFTRLRRYAETHPQAKLGGNAIRVLERTSPQWKEKLAEYGRQWRERRDCETLLHLTNQLIDRRPREGAYIADILGVMGEPDSLVAGCYTYLTKREFQGSLFLETDKNGKVVGWKLDNC